MRLPLWGDRGLEHCVGYRLAAIQSGAIAPLGRSRIGTLGLAVSGRAVTSRAIAPLGRSRIGTDHHKHQAIPARCDCPFGAIEDWNTGITYGNGGKPHVRLPLWGDRGLEHTLTRQMPSIKWPCDCPFGAIEDWNLVRVASIRRGQRCDCPFGAIEDWNLGFRSASALMAGAIAPLGRSRIGTATLAPG